MARETESKKTSARWTGLIAFAVVLLAASVLAVTKAEALRLPTEEPLPQVRAHMLWTREYLCLAVRVPDRMLTGSSEAPMSAPQEDDAVEVCLEVPGPTGPTAHRLVISAAGGMTLLTRDARGTWRTDSSWVRGPRTVKYAVTLQGTRNDPSDEDTGFVVECAIPWDFLGGEPPADREIGFNLVCLLQGESEGLVSWAPTVATREEVGNSARWGRMQISTRSLPQATDGARTICPYAMRTPIINGQLSAEEWLIASILHFDKPTPAFEPLQAAAERTGVAATLLAVYRYDWQGNTEREGGAHLWRPDGSPATIDQPKEGAGPWYSYERVEWHQGQLSEVQRSGIDVILGRYCGDEQSRRTWSRVGLDRMSEALKLMRAEGRAYPLVGMMLDTAALREMDLTSEEGQLLVYGMIREFFLHVPREFWAEVGAQPSEGVMGGVPVLLGEPEGIANWDGRFLSFCQQRFGEDFGGARIVWLGSTRWRERGATEFYCHVRLPVGTGMTQEGPGSIPGVAVSPGYCPPSGTGEELRSRRDGRAYENDWQRVLAARPELVLIGSWNDLANASEIAPSRQYGFSYVDSTRYFQSRLGSQQQYYLRLKKHSLPRVLLPGATYQTEFVIENLGTENLTTGRRITVDYGITRRSDGRSMRSQVGAQGLSIMAGQTLRLPLEVSATDSEGNSLPPGEYLFTLSVVSSRVAYLRSRWFARTVAELTVPFAVGNPPARRATVVSTSLPSSMASGESNPVVVRLRNDGASAWRQDTTQIGYHWIRRTDDLMRPSSPRREVAVWAAGRVSLPGEVAPGEIVSVIVPVAAVDGEGAPLAASSPGELWHYRVRWDAVEGEDGWFSQGTEPVAEEAIQVVINDRGVRFESSETPSAMEAGATAPVPVVVANAGSGSWETETSYLVARWYRWDGRDLGLEGGRTALTTDAAPGSEVSLETTLLAPSAPGNYWLVWDMVCNGEGFASSQGGRRADMFVAPVLVRASGVRAVDLSSMVNVSAITSDTHRARGDFDGQGRSFPAEWMPPDRSGAAEDLYPSGYYSPGEARLAIPFAFPDAGSGVGVGLACTGQSIPLGEQGVSRIHLLAASTAGARSTTFGLRSSDGETEQVELTVPSWTQPDGLARIGAYAPYVRTLTSDVAGPAVYLYHLTLEPSGGAAVSLELPPEPWIRLLAITVEEAGTAGATGEQ